MISYLEFKKILESLDGNSETEITLFFKNRKYTYMIIKYNDYITFQRCGTLEEQSGEIKFKSLDDLFNNKTIDDIILKNEWDNIEDILFDFTFSVLEDLEEICDLYKIKI